MSTVHICLNDIFGVAVSCEVIISPGDTPFFHGSAVTVSGARSVRLDAEGNGYATLLPGRYTVRFSGITNNTDTLLILVPNDEAAYELPALVTAGNWILPFRDFLQCAKNLTDVADASAAFAAIRQAAVYELKSAAFTAVADGCYALDTTAGSFDVTIDAALPIGSYIDFADARGTWNTHPPTFLRNGFQVEGAAVNYVDAAQGTFLRILNVGGATGLRILESGTKPHNLTAPAITGQYLGSSFVATTGTWTGSPTVFFYQWQSSTDGATWTNISGATAANYTPGSDLAGAFLRVNVSAANANGTSLPAASAASAALEAAPFPAEALAYWKLDEVSGVRVDDPAIP